TVPAYTDAQGKPIYQVLSDVHPGNVIVDQQNNAVYPIDRNYFLKLSKEDVDFIAIALGPTPSQEKLAPMVSYFLGLEENSGLSLEKKQVTDQIFKSFVLDKIAGKSTNSIKMMFKFLHELDRRNIQIPLRIRILMKDVDAVNKMLQKVELPSFATYLSSAGKTITGSE
ncbi:MAG: hypothetical protein WCJ13_12200, partial [Coriobacteriia bacterium]